MKITIKFTKRNASFSDQPQEEQERILERVAFAMRTGHDVSIYDINGNRIGEIRVS